YRGDLCGAREPGAVDDQRCAVGRSVDADHTYRKLSGLRRPRARPRADGDDAQAGGALRHRHDRRGRRGGGLRSPAVRRAHRRRDTLRASKIMQDRVFAHPKISFIWNSVVRDILDPAAGKVTTVLLEDVVTGARSERRVDGLFVAIGHEPNTAVFRGQIELLPSGYVRVEPGTTRTSVPGVFAAGDVQDSVFRQAVTAAGTGCMAALEA